MNTTKEKDKEEDQEKEVIRREWPTVSSDTEQQGRNENTAWDLAFPGNFVKPVSFTLNCERKGIGEVTWLVEGG